MYTVSNVKHKIHKPCQEKRPSCFRTPLCVKCKLKLIGNLFAWNFFLPFRKQKSFVWGTIMSFGKDSMYILSGGTNYSYFSFLESRHFFLLLFIQLRKRNVLRYKIATMILLLTEKMGHSERQTRPCDNGLRLWAIPKRFHSLSSRNLTLAI